MARAATPRYWEEPWRQRWQAPWPPTWRWPQTSAASCSSAIWPLALLARLAFRPQAPNREVARIAGTIAAGICLAALPLAAYLLWHGSLRAWAQDVGPAAVALTRLDFFDRSNFAALVYHALRQMVTSPSVPSLLNGLFWATLPLLAAANGFIVLRLLGRGADNATAALPVMSLFYAIVSVHFQIPVYLYYTAGLSLASLLWLAPLVSPLAARASIAFALVLAATGVYFHAGQPASRGIAGLLRGDRVQSTRASTLPHNSLRIEPEEERRYASLVELIRREVPPGAAIFAVPGNAELYFMAERRNAFRFYNTALGVRTDQELAARRTNAARRSATAGDVQPGRQIQHATLSANHGDRQTPVCSSRTVRAVRRLRAPMTRSPGMATMTDGADIRTGSQLVSVVLPAHNEEAALPLVVNAIVSAATSTDLEIVIVDDGSTDGTWRQIQILQTAHRAVRGLRFTRNFGHQSAILAGLLAARGDAVIVMDADGQHPPGLIPIMLERWRDGFQVVQAIRETGPERPIKSFFSRLFYRVLHSLSGVDVPTGSADFRLLSRPVVDAVLNSAGHLLFLRGLVPYLGYETAFVPFTAPPRVAGRTSYTWRKMVQLSVDGVMSFSIVPLRAAIAVGLAVSIASFLYLVYVVVIWLTVRSVVTGWASTAGLLSLLGGIQLLTLGIVGEYLGRLFLSSLNRPRFVIREQTGSVQERVPAATP